MSSAHLSGAAAEPANTARGLFFFDGNLLFDFHVAELARLEDFTADKAFDVFRVFVARNDLDFGVPAGITHWVVGGRSKSLLPVRILACLLAKTRQIGPIVGYFRRGMQVVKHFQY